MPVQPPAKAYTAAQLAARLGTYPGRVLELLMDGDLNFVGTENAFRITDEELERFESSLEEPLETASEALERARNASASS
jgi:hypothetical protein